MLEQLGYRVVPADSAAVALALLESGQAIDLVFSDIVMPGAIDGLGLAQLISTEYPLLPVVLTSGYAKAAGAAEAGFPILRKPYQLAALAATIREALDHRQQGRS